MTMTQHTQTSSSGFTVSPGHSAVAYAAAHPMSTSIDFSKLLREEKKRVRQRRNNPQNENGRLTKVSSPKESPITPKLLPDWSNWRELLSFSDLDLQLICSNPKSIYYSSKALSISDSASLRQWLENLPSGESGFGEWKAMKYGKRRASMFGETKESPLVGPLKQIALLLLERGIFTRHEPPNHVLLNEYQPGQGILPHTDGPSYTSRTATISLASSVVLEFRRRFASDEIGTKEDENGNGPIQVLLEAGSMIVFEEDAYLEYCHGIPMDTLQDMTNENCLNASANKLVQRGHRYSLTFRHKKNGIDFGAS